MTRHLEEGLRRLDGRVKMTVGRFELAKSDSTTQFQELQIDVLADETHDGVEHFESYGLTSRPKAGAEGVMLAVNGLRSHGIAICVGDRRYRMTGLQEGEVALHDDQGQSVVLGRDGIVIHGKALTFESDGDIAFSADGDFTIDAASVTVTSDGAQQYLSDDIKVGNGATKGAARKDDAVNDSLDIISGGSTKVKIG